MACRCSTVNWLRYRSTPLFILACGLLVVAFPACQSAKQRHPLTGADVVLVVVDTLRADHLGLAGYPWPTSPFLDRLASESVVFTDVAAPSSYTRESIASLFSGAWPSCAGAVGWDATPERAQVTLAETFRRAGYATAMVTLTTMLGHPAFARGFDRVEHLASQWGVSRASPKLTQRALDLWNEPNRKPVFLYLHYLDPHGPYDPPPAVLQKFPQASDLVLDLYRDVRPHLPELSAQGFDRKDPRFRELVRRYDAEIGHTDGALEQLFEGLRGHARGRPLLVIVTADHGEEFLEHDFVEHAWTLYEEAVRVPLLWWSPGVLSPARSDQPASLVDVYPTLVRLLRLEEPPLLPHAGGRSLFEITPHEVRPANLQGRARWAELGIAERNVLRALWLDGWKYTAARRWLEPAERSRSSQIEETLRAQRTVPSLPSPEVVAREELFHLPSDPTEAHDRKSDAVERLAQMRALAAQQEQRCPLQSRAASTPLSLAPHEVEALRQLGY
ncbi:MAG: hypothetical protein KatS3mg077_2362 [Candidatus Binatia bacterium]|nr:MAG: hypothetical protein KatS3mg077_2362 [Candidatus Binatia bacterium]